MGEKHRATQADVDALREIAAGAPRILVPTCRYCGGECATRESCPRVEEVEYNPSGDLKRVRLRSYEDAFTHMPTVTGRMSAGRPTLPARPDRGWFGGLPDPATADLTDLGLRHQMKQVADWLQAWAGDSPPTTMVSERARTDRTRAANTAHQLYVLLGERRAQETVRPRPDVDPSAPRGG